MSPATHLRRGLEVVVLCRRPTIGERALHRSQYRSYTNNRPHSGVGGARLRIPAACHRCPHRHRHAHLGTVDRLPRSSRVTAYYCPRRRYRSGCVVFADTATVATALISGLDLCR
eukprot:TRINITY_DN71033_c0_g1_i1.p3 TRINITY_DN71033_c0_g1~~TRINITY_DN71033_c0_g1_i1.p3  ORF type:complete len:115 (-),score=8.15 TRINITY_DN71033_c0_g1_i1:505-849(-)